MLLASAFDESDVVSFSQCTLLAISFCNDTLHPVMRVIANPCPIFELNVFIP